MGAFPIILDAPLFDLAARIGERNEDVFIQAFLAQARIEALDKAVLPWAARRDVGGLRADAADPLLHRFGNELRAIVGTDVLGDATQNEQIGKHIDDVDRFEPARDPNGQALVGELIDDVEQAILRRSWVRPSRKS